MATDRTHSHHSDLPDMSAELIAGRRFGQTWRGYDPDEVKQFLARVATQVRLLRERIETADSARREAEQRASHPEMDEATLMSAVGEETAGILRSARSAAAEITAKAEANAEALVTAAEAKASDLVARAESLLASRTVEAEATAAEILASAETEAGELRTTAQQLAEALGEKAAQKYQETVQAAQDVREAILTDLARRRNLATVQIEQLRAGRERLLDAYLVVRRTLDEVTDELQRAGAEARAASEAVRRQAGGEPAEELMDLRGQEAWGSPKQGGTEAPSSSKEQSSAEQAPVVTAPKVAQIVTTQSGRRTEAPAPVLPAPIKAEGLAERRSAGVRPAAPDGQEDTAVLSRADSIESVRILRHESAQLVDQPATAPQQVTRARAAKARGAAAKEPAVTDRHQDLSPQPAAEPAGGSATGGPDNGTVTSQERDLQGLFARIRASRAQATSEARKALLDADEAVGAPVEAGADAGLAADAPPAASAGPDIDLAAGPPPTSTGPAVAGTGLGVAKDIAAREEQGPGSDPGTGKTGGGRDEFFERRNEVAGHLGSLLARKLKRALQDEQNSILDRLRNLKSPPTPANALPSAEEQPDRFVEAGRPLLEEAARAGAQLAAAVCGDGTLRPGLGLERIDDLAEELGRAIAEPLHQRLELAFRSSGEDPAELADALGAAYREWKTQRIESAAHDQVTAAFSRGAYLAFPEGALLHWVVDPSEGPCPDCEDNELAGDQPKGDVWPTGQLYPPAHPGCRCALAPAKLPPSAPIGATPLPTSANSSRD